MKWKLRIRKEIIALVAMVGVSFLIAFSDRKQRVVMCKDVIIELETTGKTISWMRRT